MQFNNKIIISSVNEMCYMDVGESPFSILCKHSSQHVDLYIFLKRHMHMLHTHTVSHAVYVQYVTYSFTISVIFCICFVQVYVCSPAYSNYWQIWKACFVRTSFINLLFFRKVSLILMFCCIAKLNEI